MGLCIYSSLAQTTVDNFPDFKNLNDDQILNELSKLTYVPGLSELMSDCLRSTCLDMNAGNILFSRTVMTWKLITMIEYNENLKLQKTAHVKGLMTGLFFRSEGIYKKCVEFLASFPVDYIVNECKQKPNVIYQLIKGFSLHKVFYHNKDLTAFMIEFLLSVVNGFPYIKERAGELNLFYIFSHIHLANIDNSTLLRNLVDLIVRFS